MRSRIITAKRQQPSPLPPRFRDMTECDPLWLQLSHQTSTIIIEIHLVHQPCKFVIFIDSNLQEKRHFAFWLFFTTQQLCTFPLFSHLYLPFCHKFYPPQFRYTKCNDHNIHQLLHRVDQYHFLQHLTTLNKYCLPFQVAADYPKSPLPWNFPSMVHILLQNTNHNAQTPHLSSWCVSTYHNVLFCEGSPSY